MDTPAALYGRVYSFYRFNYPAAFAVNLALFIRGGFEKRYGIGILNCVYCNYTADCTLEARFSRLPLQLVEHAHYEASPECRLKRLEEGILDDVLFHIEMEIGTVRPACQYLFEDDLLRCCASDPDFRELTFALGQWRFKSTLPASRLAKSGFYFAQKKQQARCMSCLIAIDTPARMSNLEEWHANVSPNCAFVKRVLQQTWQATRFLHDSTGHLVQDTDEIQVICHTRARPGSLARHSLSAADDAGTSTSAGPTKPKQMKRQIQTPHQSGSLSQLCATLNSLGLTDAELRKAIVLDTGLLECQSSAAFLERLALKRKQGQTVSVSSETDLRGGQMAVITDYKCGYCVSGRRDTAFVPCGHVYGCTPCCQRVLNAPTLDGRRCSVCRDQVTSLLSLHLTDGVTEY